MSYFSRSDYYSEGQELVGQWHGEGARRLGLAGEIRKRDWDALCNNRHPATGEKLTLRSKDNRRVGYDFTFDAHKSVSVLYGLTKNERILDAFLESVRETMSDIECEMKTRVRKDGKNDDPDDGQHRLGRARAFHVKAGGRLARSARCISTAMFSIARGTRKSRHGRPVNSADVKRDARYFEAKCDSRFARRLAGTGHCRRADEDRLGVGRYSRLGHSQVLAENGTNRGESQGRRALSIRRRRRNWGRRRASTSGSN